MICYSFGPLKKCTRCLFEIKPYKAHTHARELNFCVECDYYQCQYCDFWSESIKTLQKHLNIDHSLKEYVYYCKYCQTVIFSNIKVHVCQDYMKNIDATDFIVRRLKTVLNFNLTFSKLEILIAQYAINNNNFWYCSGCNVPFPLVQRRQIELLHYNNNNNNNNNDSKDIVEYCNNPLKLCPYCKEYTTSLDYHLKVSCGRQTSNYGCDCKYNYLTESHAYECPEYEIVCLDCEQKIKRKDAKTHQNTCDPMIYNIDFSANNNITAIDIINNDNDFKCPYCFINIAEEKKHLHLTVECLNVSVKLECGCERVRSQLGAHNKYCKTFKLIDNLRSQIKKMADERTIYIEKNAKLNALVESLCWSKRKK